MDQLLSRLFELIRTHTGLADLPINPGLDDARIDELWEPTELPLPDEYRALIRVFDGQVIGGGLTFPPGELTFRSLEDAVEEWRRLSQYEADDEPFDELIDEGRVRSVTYHSKRFPIADNEIAVAGLFLDFIPGDQGREGQLVFNPEEGAFYTVAPSIHQLVTDYIGLLESGRAKVTRRTPEYGGELAWLTPDGKLVDFDEYMRLIKG